MIIPEGLNLDFSMPSYNLIFNYDSNNYKYETVQLVIAHAFQKYIPLFVLYNQDPHISRLYNDFYSKPVRLSLSRRHNGGD